MTDRVMRRATCALLVMLYGAFAPTSRAFAQTSNAFAQTTSARPQATAPAKPAAPKRGRDVTIGGVFSGPLSMGSADASLLGSGGTPTVLLFKAESELAPGFGADVAFGFQLRRTVWFEVGAGVMKTGLRTHIVNDFEGASSVTIDAPVTRLSAEGAVLWYFRDKGKTSWFLRGSGGLLRDMSGEFTKSDGGFIGSGGVGFRYWWRTTGKGTFKRVGLRAEFKALVQSGGVSLGGRSINIGPAGAVHLVFGY